MAEESMLTTAAAALETLRAAVSRSPADETALTLLETWSAVATAGGGKAEAPRARRFERRLQARVVEAGRAGAFRVPGLSAAELDGGVRQAMANARASEPLGSGIALTPADDGDGDAAVALLHDPAVASLAGDEAAQRLREWASNGEAARLAWSETALTVVTSRGFARQ